MTDVESIATFMYGGNTMSMTVYVGCENLPQTVCFQSIEKFYKFLDACLAAKIKLKSGYWDLNPKQLKNLQTMEGYNEFFKNGTRNKNSAP